MSQYSFVTHWTFKAPLTAVWNVIRDMDHWPTWWKYVESVELIHQGDANDLGSIRRIVWSTALPYKLVFDSKLVSVTHHHRIEGIAIGELTGLGVWIFETKGDTTHVRYDWKVSTTKKWMNFFSPIARPLFRWNHDKVMNAGYEGLRKRLESAL